MSKVYEIDKHCLRYVVAFTYKGSFDAAILAVKNQEEEIYKRNKETKEKNRLVNIGSFGQSYWKVLLKQKAIFTNTFEMNFFLMILLINQKKRMVVSDFFGKAKKQDKAAGSRF